LPTAAALGSSFGGVRLDKLGKVSVTKAGAQKLRDERSKLTEQTKILNAQGITSKNATPEYKALRKRINDINKVLDPRKRTGVGGSGLTPADIGIGSTGSDLSPADIGLGG
jgi:hypothetical protein